MKRYVILAAAVLMQACLGGVYAWSALATPLQNVYGLTLVETSTIFSTTILVFTSSVLLTGRLQDRFGPRYLATAGGVLLGAGYLLGSLSHGRYGFLLATTGVVNGLGIGCGYVCAVATAVRWFPKNSGLVTGLAAAGYGAGAVALAPIIHGLLASGWDVLEVFRALGLGCGGIATACGLVLTVPPRARAALGSEASLAGKAKSGAALLPRVRQPPRPPWPARGSLSGDESLGEPEDPVTCGAEQASAGERLAVADGMANRVRAKVGAAVGAHAVEGPRHLPAGKARGAPVYRDALRELSFWRLAAGIFCGSMAGFVVNPNLQRIATNWSLTDAIGASAILAMAAGSTTGRVLWGAFYDRIGGRRALVLVQATGIFSVLLLLGIGGRAPGAFLAGIAVLGFCYGGNVAVYAPRLAELYGHRRLGSLYAILLLAHGSAGMVGNRLNGWLFERTGSFRPGLGLIAALMAMGLTFWILTLRSDERRVKG